MSYLLDTDICSAHLRNDRRVAGKFMQHSGRLHVSAVTAGELFAWGRRAKSSPRLRAAIRDFLDGVTVHDLTEVVAETFGDLRAAPLDAGRPVPALDLLIAATAVRFGLTLVTHNVRDYANVPGPVTEDWLAP